MEELNFFFLFLLSSKEKQTVSGFRQRGMIVGRGDYSKRDSHGQVQHCGPSDSATLRRQAMQNADGGRGKQKHCKAIKY